MGKIVDVLKSFKLSETLLGMALVGAEWVLWLLVLLSVISVAILIYKGLFFVTLRSQGNGLLQRVRTLLRAKDIEGALAYVRRARGIEAQVLLAGLNVYAYGMASIEDAMLAEKIRVRLQMERGLAFLGTLGSNAPFIGLFGTVLEIIRAFRDLSTSNGDPKKVMVGISGALVATAVGLMVAIPAVVGFNFYNRLVRSRMARVDATVQDVLSVLKETHEVV